VIGLLAWLAWDVGVDAEEASKRGGLQGVEDETWYHVQLLGSLGPWIVDDENAAKVLDEGVDRTPRYRVDGERWLQTHRELLDGLARVEADPGHYGQMGRRARAGDIVVLSEHNSPRVRVVLEARPASRGVKIVLLDPAKKTGQCVYSSSHVASLPWPRSESLSVASA